MRIRTTLIYRDWINALKDRAARARIQVRVDRLAHGNPGQHRHLTQGISELKVDVGPGYLGCITPSEAKNSSSCLSVVTKHPNNKISPWLKSLRAIFRSHSHASIHLY